MARPVANPTTENSQDQHSTETISAPMLNVFLSLRERLNNSNKTNSLYMLGRKRLFEIP